MRFIRACVTIMLGFLEVFVFLASISTAGARMEPCQLVHTTASGSAAKLASLLSMHADESATTPSQSHLYQYSCMTESGNVGDQLVLYMDGVHDGIWVRPLVQACCVAVSYKYP
jgi:hypothetical protein